MTRTLWRALQAVVILGLAGGVTAVAQAPAPERLSGVISDYGPSNVKPTGPWEIRGPWSLKLEDEGSQADFSAALTMELSDYSQSPATIDVPGARGQHTHHVTMEDGTVTPLPNGGFEVNGPVTIAKDGSAVFGGSSLVIDVTGGTSIAYSNITMTFQGPATAHFGSQAIHGVVRKAKS